MWLLSFCFILDNPRKRAANWPSFLESRGRWLTYRYIYIYILSTFCASFFPSFFPPPHRPLPSWIPSLPRTSKLLRFLEEMQYSRGWGAARVLEGVTPQKKKGISLKKWRAKIGQYIYIYIICMCRTVGSGTAVFEKTGRFEVHLRAGSGPTRVSHYKTRRFRGSVWQQQKRPKITNCLPHGARALLETHTWISARDCWARSQSDGVLPFKDSVFEVTLCRGFAHIPVWKYLCV